MGPSDYAFQEVWGPKVDQQIQFYEQRCRERPNRWPDLSLLALAYVAKGDENPEFFGKGEEVAQRSLKIRREGNVDAYVALAAAAAGKGQWNKCWDYCQKAPDSPDLLPLGIDCLLEFGRLQEATEWTARYLKVANNSTPAVTRAAQISVLRGRDDVALQLLQSARFQEQPQQHRASAELRYWWGDWYLRHGRLAEARKMLLASLQIRRRNLPALRALAQLDLEQGHPDAALQSLTAAHQYSQQPELLVEMARVQQALGHLDEARQLRTQAEPLLEGQDLARLRLDQQRPQEALEILQQEVKKGWANWTCYQLQAQAHEALHQPAQALTAVASALGEGYREPHLLTQAVRLARLLKDPRANLWEEQLEELKAPGQGSSRSPAPN